MAMAHGSLGSPEPAILWTGQVQMSTGQPSPIVLACACEFENCIVKLLEEFPATEKHKNWQSVPLPIPLFMAANSPMIQSLWCSIVFFWL